MLDRQHQREDNPAHADKARNGLPQKIGRGSLPNHPSCPPDDPFGYGTELPSRSCQGEALVNLTLSGLQPDFSNYVTITTRQNSSDFKTGSWIPESNIKRRRLTRIIKMQSLKFCMYGQLPDGSTGSLTLLIAQAYNFYHHHHHYHHHRHIISG